VSILISDDPIPHHAKLQLPLSAGASSRCASENKLKRWRSNESLSGHDWNVLKAQTDREAMPQEEVAMNIEMKGAQYWLFIMSLGAQACSTGPTSAMAAEQSGNSSTCQTGGHARPNYIKVEAVREFHATPPSVRLTGKVCYDENHTQRVAAPIDGRVNRILVTLGDRVLPGQALIELTAPGVSTLQADA